MSEIIRSIEQKQLRTDLPKLEIGDTVRVFVLHGAPCFLRHWR